MVESPEGRAQPCERVFELGLRFGLRLPFLEVDEEGIRRAFGRGDLLAQHVAEALQIAPGRIQRAVRFEEGLLVVDAPEDAGDELLGQPGQARRESVDEALARLQVVGAHHHGERGESADAILELPQRDRGRRSLRQQFTQVRAQISVQARGEGRRRRQNEGSSGHDGPWSPHGQGGEPLPQPVASAPRGNGLDAVQGGFCYPAPWRSATIAIASRRSASPASPTSFSMVRAGCKRMAWV